MTKPSPKVSKLYPWEDYEWYACDGSGHVAVFTSAGVGPIPSVVLSSRSIADTFAGVVRKMAARGRATMLASLPRPDDYIHFASCGLFAYDWQDVHRTVFFKRRYEVLSRPDTPIHLSELPEQLRSLVGRTAFTGLRFADSREIDVRAYFDCEPAA